MILFPRLRKPDAERRFAELKGRSVGELRVDDVSVSDDAFFAQTGGRRAGMNELQRIRHTAIKIAGRFGFPNAGTEKSRAEFDAVCAVWLRNDAGINLGEGFRDDVWAYLTIELLPDVASWRFPQRNLRRFLGGMRNTFQRLWRRAYLLDDAGDAKLLRHYLLSLQEDTFVQLIERPGASANPFVASRIAAAWIRATGDPGARPMEATHRLVMKELTQVGAVVSLDTLPAATLDSLLDELYRELGLST